MVSLSQALQVAVLSCLLLASAGSEGAPTPTSSPAPEQLAAIEYGPEGARLVVLNASTGRVQWAGTWRGDSLVGAPSWSPDGTFLLYRQGDALLLHRVNEQGALQLAGELSMPSDPVDFALRPDGQQAAVLRPDSVELISIGTGDGMASSSRRVPMPSGCIPSSLQWQGEEPVRMTVCTEEDLARAGALLPIAPKAGAAESRLLRGAVRLTGWRLREGPVSVGTENIHWEEAVLMVGSGAFTALLLRPASVELILMGLGPDAAASSRSPSSSFRCGSSRQQRRSEGPAWRVLCYSENPAEPRPLLRVDPATGTTETWLVRGVVLFLGWSAHHGLLVSGLENRQGSRGGTLTEDGAFTALGPQEPADAKNQDEPLTMEFVQGYLPSIDRFVMAEASEDSGDAVVLKLVPLGPGPTVRWLKAFAQVSGVSYGAPDPWVAFIHRKPSSRDGVGDIYMVRAGQENARLIKRSEPKRDIFYASPVPRPRPVATARSPGKPEQERQP